MKGPQLDYQFPTPRPSDQVGVVLGINAQDVPSLGSYHHQVLFVIAPVASHRHSIP
jgi:hypothetical protein